MARLSPPNASANELITDNKLLAKSKSVLKPSVSIVSADNF